ncbi:MAG: DMT family transporter [Pseudomonadota bacterium]
MRRSGLSPIGRLMIAPLRSGIDTLYASPALLLVLTTLFWGGNAIAGQVAQGHITPMQLVLFRWIAVALIMWPLFGAEVRAHWPQARPRLGRITVMAILGFTAFNILFYVASLETSGVNIGILQGAIPVFVLLGALLAYGTRITALQGVGVAATLAGVVLIATAGAPLQIIEIGLNRGDAIMLVACMFYAAYAVLLQTRPQVPGVVLFTLMAGIAMITAIPPAIYEAFQPGTTWPTWEGWLICLYVAIFPSCLSQLFFLRGVDLIGPGRAGVYTNLVPVFASILAVGLLGQVFAWYHALALVLVIGGIVVAQWAARS